MRPRSLGEALGSALVSTGNFIPQVMQFKMQRDDRAETRELNRKKFEEAKKTAELERDMLSADFWMKSMGIGQPQEPPSTDDMFRDWLQQNPDQFDAYARNKVASEAPKVPQGKRPPDVAGAAVKDLGKVVSDYRGRKSAYENKYKTTEYQRDDQGYRTGKTVTPGQFDEPPPDLLGRLQPHLALAASLGLKPDSIQGVTAQAVPGLGEAIAQQRVQEMRQNRQYPGPIGPQMPGYPPAVDSTQHQQPIGPGMSGAQRAAPGDSLTQLQQLEQDYAQGKIDKARYEKWRRHFEGQ